MTISENIRRLRKSKELTQAQLASKIGVNRSVIGAYEEGRAEPRLETLVNLAHYFDVSIDFLVRGSEVGKIDLAGNHLRVIPITVDRSTDKELITVVPLKASAGYLSGYGDLDYVDSLPRFSLPLQELKQDRTYRAFQIEGDSMLPILPGTYVLGQFVQDWNHIRNRESYVVITEEEGIVFKRLVNNIDSDASLTLKSDNPSYTDLELPIVHVREIWKAVGFISFTMPDEYPEALSLSALTEAISELRNDVRSLGKN